MIARPRPATARGGRLVTLPRRALAACAAILTLAAALLVVLVTQSPAAAAPAAAAPASARPTAVVALGDSAASGEGAGDYEPGTLGEGGDWCHRSANAFVHRTRLAKNTVDLACSGATSADVGFGAPGHYAEGSQVKKLINTAARYRITTVVMQVGANDEPGVSEFGVQCIRAYLNPFGPGCSDQLRAGWAARMAAMVPQVERAATDVRSAMRRAGYADGDYQFVLVSYSSPVSENMVLGHGISGCPFRVADAQWARTEAIPELSTALRGVADHSGLRFLDLARATEGHEACSAFRPSVEWQRRLTVSPQPLIQGGLSEGLQHVAQESFHPSAAGTAQIGACLTEFVNSGAQGGQCLVGPDNQLHASSGQPSPAPA